MNYFSSNFKLGILGGGQLGKMLLFDTRKFDIQTYVLDSSEEAPCKIACNKFFQGDLMDFETVYNFGKLVDVLTFEIEMVNLEALEKLEKIGYTFDYYLDGIAYDLRPIGTMGKVELEAL